MSDRAVMTPRVYDRATLLQIGYTDRQVRSAVAGGTLIKLRRGLFATTDLDDLAVRALALGGLPDCLTELERLGVWVLRDGRLHVHFSPSAKHRPRIPGTVRHWRALIDETTVTGVGVVNALAEAVHCTSERAAVAAIDSALHRRLVDAGSLEVIAQRSIRGRRIVGRADGSAESGLESMVRLLATSLGFHVRCQVSFPGIGRVDLVIEGFVVVEADGDEFHSDLAARRRDRRRDAALAAIGRSVLRFGYDQIVGDPMQVAVAIIEAVRIHRLVDNGGRIADSGQRRLDRLHLA